MTDPLHEAVHALRAAKKSRRQRPAEEQPEPPATMPIVSQGGRSASMPTALGAVDHNDVLREAIAELTGRPRWIRLRS